MGKFDKNSVCEYCKNEMTASYRSKRFCSDKCRIYFRRENVQFIKQKTGQIDVQEVTNIQKNVTELPVNKELSKKEMFKLMREGKM